MYGMGFIKKVVPFFLTFAIGLFVASFFVSIAVPNFKIPNRGWRRHQQYHQRIETENQRLREKNLRIDRELAEIKRELAEKERSEVILSSDGNFDVPPPPPMPPAPYKPMSQRR